MYTKVKGQGHYAFESWTVTQKTVDRIQVFVVVIGFLPSLAYWTIISLMSSGVIDLHIYICMHASSYQPLIVPVYA